MSTDTENRYYYSEAIGLVKNTSEQLLSKLNQPGFETEDLALCDYYKKQATVLRDDIEMASERLAGYRLDNNRLDKEFGHLKEEYPEEFL